MAVTASYIDIPPIVNLQGNPCVISATSSLVNATDIYMHLRIQELIGAVWTDTDMEDSIPIVDGAAVFDVSGYFDGRFSPAFSFPEHSSNLVIPRPGMVRLFRVKVWESYLDEDGVLQDKSAESLQMSQTTYMLPGGISDDDMAVLNENSTDWWAEHLESGRALNWMPGTKTIAPESVEKIYWIQPITATVTLRFSYLDVDGNAGTYDYAQSMAAYVPQELSVSPALLEDLTGKQIASYTVTLVGKDFSQEYLVDRKHYEWSATFLMSNAFGVYEGLWCRGARKEEYTYQRNSYQRSDRRNLRFADRMLGNIRGNFNRTNETNTGWLDTNWLYWSAELLNTDDAFYIRDFKLLPILIDSESIEVYDNYEQGPQSITFEWKYSRTGKFGSRMGIKAAYLFPPYYNKLTAFFQYIRSGVLLDSIAGYQAIISGTNITFPNITGNDIFDFSDAIYWDQTLIGATAWYNAGAPRTCPLTWLVGATWAEAATDATHARMFHRDYTSKLRDVLPVLVYSSNLSAAEQQVVVDWLDWYYAIFESTSLLIENNETIIE